MRALVRALTALCLCVAGVRLTYVVTSGIRDLEHARPSGRDGPTRSDRLAPAPSRSSTPATPDPEPEWTHEPHEPRPPRRPVATRPTPSPEPAVEPTPEPTEGPTPPPAATVPPSTPTPAPIPTPPSLRCRRIVELADGFKAFIDEGGPYGVGEVVGGLAIVAITESGVQVRSGGDVVLLPCPDSLQRPWLSGDQVLAAGEAIDRGRRHFRESRFDEAIEAYRRALAMDPASLDAAFGMALCFLKQGRLSEAGAQLERSIGHNPSSPKLYNALAYVLVRMKEADKAVRMARRATRLGDGEADYWDTLGQAYLVARRWDEARDSFERALRLDPELASAAKGLEEAKAQGGSGPATR